MNAYSDPKVQELVVMAGAQLGKSEILLNIIGMHVHVDPCPILMLQPSLDMAQSFSKDRIANGLLRSTPCLQGRYKEARARDSNNTTMHKVFQGGGSLSLVGANSPAGLASRPIRIVLADEVDRMPASAGSEGNPLQLARKRTATFFNRKIVSVSTPTNKNASAIEDAYELTDKRRFFVPCKHCDHKQVLRWANVRWVDEDPQTAGYTCEECGALWNDAERRWSVNNGEWVAEKEFNGIAGFHISGLYSPWAPLSDIVKEFLAVKKNPEQLRVFINTVLAETYEEEGEKMSELELAERREPMASVPDNVAFATCGVDVQDDRLEATVVFWSRFDECYVYSHDVLYGDPSTPQLWRDLETLLFRTYQTESGREIGIRATCVDSGGHFTNTVYKFCKRHYGRRVFAIKGQGGEGVPIAGKPSKNNTVKCPLFRVGVDATKDLLFARMRVKEAGPGYIHFSDDLPETYFDQLTAEKVVTRFVRGYKKRVFVKVRPRNEALDCFVYAIAALAILNTDVNSILDRLELGKEEEPEDSDPKEAQQRWMPRTGNGFVNNWR